MHRFTRIILVAFAAVVAGGCAGKAVHLAFQPAPPLTVAVSEPQPLLDVLPIRELNLSEILVPIVHAQEPASASEPICDVLAQMASVRPQLASTSLTVGTKKYTYTEVRGGGKKTYHEPEQQIALALLNPDTCTTRIVTIIQRGSALVAPTGYDIEAVKRLNGIQWNGRSTEYHVNEPEGLFVIGVAFPDEQEKKVPYELRAASGKLLKKTKKVKVVVNQLYTPYSRELDSPPVISASQEYQQSVMQRVDDRLRAASVRSLTQPSQLIVNVKALKSQYVIRKLLIEHMDMGEFLLGPEETTRRVNVVLGMNQDQFANHVCSPAKACGPGQFIKATWKLMVTKQPAAALIKDFAVGARNMLESLTAARLLDDYHLSVAYQELSSSEYEHLLADPRLTEEFLAVSYNGGPGRALPLLRAYLAHPDRSTDWSQALPTCKRKHQKHCVPAETQGYIAKLRYVRDEWPDDMLAWANQTSE